MATLRTRLSTIKERAFIVGPLNLETAVDRLQPLGMPHER